MTIKEFNRICKWLSDSKDISSKVLRDMKSSNDRIIEFRDSIKWFRNAMEYVDKYNSDLYNNAIKYADEIEEGCI